MKLVVRIVICFLISLFALQLAAQAPADSINIEYFSDFELASSVFRNDSLKKDSLLQSYFFFDILKQKELYVPVSGNIGSASYRLFDATKSVKPLTSGFNQFVPYEITPLKSFPLPNVERRFTNINYHIGSKKEQHVFITHQQIIRPWMIAGLDFGALSAPGDFSRTLSRIRNFDIYFGYEAPSKVYRNYISFTSNRVDNQENGGISSDSVFENASSLNTRTLPINLPNASVFQRTRDYFLKQELNLSRLIQPGDSSDFAGKFKSGSLVLNHSIWWNRKSNTFMSMSADSSFFNNYFLDSAVTFDSSFYNDLYQVVVLEYSTLPTSSGNSFSLGGGYEYQHIDYETSWSDTIYNVGAAVLTAGFDSRKLSISLFYSKTVYGDFKEGYRSRLGVVYKFGKNKNHLYLEAGAGRLAHSAKELMYVSNHFIWKNDFDLLEQYDVSAGISFKKLNLILESRSRISKNFVFFREDFLPQTYDDYVAVYELSVSNIFRIGKFGLDNKVTVSTTSNSDVLPVPSAATFSAIYYHNRFFKQVLGFKMGVDLRYNTSYNVYGYMPATGIFYVQDEKRIGDYPMAGIFVELKIKTALTLFIRVDHLNSGFGERSYYGAYHYPLPGRTFKFGLSWDLVN